MKQQKLFHLVLSAMLIVCTTGCYDKDEIKDAEKYLFKDIQYSFEEGDGFSTYDVELLPFIMENNLNNSITTTNSPFEDTWQETTFQSNDPEAFVWMGEEDVFVNTPYMFGDELLLSGATIKYGSETTKAKGPNSSTSTISIQPHCRLDLERINYIEGMGDYVKIFCKDSPKPILSLCSMKYMEEKLPANEFIRVHRSFIVRMDCISAIGRSTLLIEQKDVPIGDAYRERVKGYVSRLAVL
jgi:hypothetical protein